MIKEKSKTIKRSFVEATIGTRKYFSYRADLMLYKLILCILILFVIYIITSELVFSIFISLQVFIIFTLINKLNIERKEKEGKKILLNKIKKEYFIKKLNDIEIAGFESLIKYFFFKQGYLNYKRIGKHMFLTELNNDKYYIKIFKLFDGAEVEKIDVRSFISLMSQNNIKNGAIVTNNTISDEAKKMLEKINENIKISIIDTDELYNLTEKFNLLPENKVFYNKIYNEKIKKKNENVILNNTFSNKKTIIYILAASFFYITAKVTPYNFVALYISYYFIILTIISVAYFIYLKIYNNKEDKV